MESFRNTDGGGVVEALIRTIQENAVLLSDIDGAIGDGDHGINMKKGFTLCAERIAGKGLSMSDSLSTLGSVLIGEIGGAMGPLYGTFFREMAKSSREKESINASVFQSMIEKATDGVVGLGNAHVGDKTLLDTLAPARDAFGAAVQTGKTFTEALTAMVEAAEKGKESTRDMVARVGRASRLGERSRGVLDAGAASCCLILTSMARSMSQLLAGA